jgi:hypothetical protein
MVKPLSNDLRERVVAFVEAGRGSSLLGYRRLLSRN